MQFYDIVLLNISVCVPLVYDTLAYLHSLSPFVIERFKNKNKARNKLSQKIYLHSLNKCFIQSKWHSSTDFNEITHTIISICIQNAKPTHLSISKCKYVMVLNDGEVYKEDKLTNHRLTGKLLCQLKSMPRICSVCILYTH